jgi:hypothetical protein
MLNSKANTSAILQSALATTGTNGNYTSNTNSYAINSLPTNNSVFKAQPAFKMEIYKSENGGFIMNLITNSNTYSEDSKMFILNDMKNLGNDIQNILLTEILKS